MKELTTQTGIIVKCSKTAIEFFQNAQSVDFFSALEIPKEFQDIAQTGIIVKCSKTAIEFFQNAQSVDFFSALEIPKEFQDIAVEFYDLILENDHLMALLGCHGNYDIAVQIDDVTGTMMGWIGSNEGNGMIEYIKLFWEGAPEGEPSVILYEVDTGNERLALRSIDIFMDGHTYRK